MPEPTLILFDDRIARTWEPFALTRPVGELLFGTHTLRARAARIFEAEAALHLSAEHLLGFQEDNAPPVRTPDDPPAEGNRIFLLSRAVPAWGARFPDPPEGPSTIEMGDEIVGWYAPAGTPAPEPAFFDAPQTTTPRGASNRPIELPGKVLHNIWDLVADNPEQITTDMSALYPTATARPLPPGVHHWGGHPLIWDATARIEPGAALDTTAGPIWLRRGATVRAFTRLAGPAYVGPDSTVLGGTLEAVSLGPVCKVRGELAESVCLGYVNKAHDGHIGHAYLGRWVNLGAETTNSDLKNNYGTIRIHTPEGDTDTGLTKLGCFLGDHVKTGIGLLLNTGTVIGAGSNLYGAEMPPKFVPPFSWGTGDELVAYRSDKFLEVAERAMARRDVTLTDSVRQQLTRAWERGRNQAEPDAGLPG